MRRPVAVAILAIAALAVVVGATGSFGSSSQSGIAYVTGGASSPSQVWLADLDGRHPRRLGTGAKPRISPDGSRVAASGSGSSGPALTLFSSSGDSATPRRFFDLSRETAVAQAWSTDSRYLAVVLSSTDPASAAASGLAVIDAANGSYRMLAHGPVYGASFAPDGTHRVVYGAASSPELNARVDVRVAAVDGSRTIQLTHDGRSLNPVWGHGEIVFDRERLRAASAPAYDLWVMASDGGHPAPLTRMPVPPLLNGLVPLQLSADGARLLAAYEGQDTSQAWTVTLATGQARQLRVDGHSVAGGAISRNGATVLIDRGGFLNAPDSGAVESIPFSAGRPSALIAHGSEPSWNL